MAAALREITSVTFFGSVGQSDGRLMLKGPVKRLGCIKTDDGGVARGRVNHPSLEFVFYFVFLCAQLLSKQNTVREFIF